jgi:ribosomal-protein-serine acetyltransferase
VRLANLPVDDDLVLAPRTGGDAPEMFALVERHREELREWLPWIDATLTVGDARRYAQFAQAQFESHTAFDYAIRFRRAIVGAIGLHALDWGSRNAAIGYWLVPDARGHGLMTRACETLVAHAFGTLELHRLEIRCVVENERSRAVAERLRFRFEGTLAQAYLLHGVFRDLALYATIAT